MYICVLFIINLGIYLCLFTYISPSLLSFFYDYVTLFSCVEYFIAEVAMMRTMLMKDKCHVICYEIK